MERSGIAKLIMRMSINILLQLFQGRTASRAIVFLPSPEPLAIELVDLIGKFRTQQATGSRLEASEKRSNIIVRVQVYQHMNVICLSPKLQQNAVSLLADIFNDFPDSRNHLWG